MNNQVIRPIIIACVLFSNTASARKVEDWPYQRLFQQADIVVIAGAIDSVSHEENWTEPLFDPKQFKGVSTQLRVISTVKGTPTQIIKVLHYKYADSNMRINDGPGLISFLSRPVSINVHPLQDSEQNPKAPLIRRVSGNPAPEYLLFLKKRQDGSYEAVSGQVDPTLSVRVLLDLEAIQN
jgi:hypothetical protein